MEGIINRANTRLNNVIGNTATMSLNGASSTGSSLPYIVGFLVLLFLIIAVLHTQIMYGINVAYDSIRDFFGATNKNLITGTDNDVLTAPEPPQDAIADKRALIEKVLPGREEVFNISQNRFTSYDAEPLCKALGAELATYEQVKESWDKGADWCNYGWVKGQLAVYPTQTATWEKLQSGPEEQRGACGRPGVNGGYFDNPELRFGVNCHGVKPAQSKHDENAIAAGAPTSPGALEFDKKVAHFKSEADHIGMSPFNSTSW